MKPNATPVRLIDGVGVSGDLRLALRAARAAGPDARELQLLALRANEGLRAPPPRSLAPAGPKRSPTLAKGMAAMAVIASGAWVGLAWHGHPGAKSAVENDAVTVAPATASQDVALDVARETASGGPAGEDPAPVASVASVAAVAPAARAGSVARVASVRAAAPGSSTPVAPVDPPRPGTMAVAPHTSPTSVGPTTPGANDPASDVDPSGEARLLTDARGELKENPRRALALAEEHERRFAGGLLVEEREVIAITALVHLGREEEGAARWQSYRARFPRSAYQARLSALFAKSGPSIEKDGAPSPLTP